MSKTMRTARNFATLAATGTLAFTLGACSLITGGGEPTAADSTTTAEDPANTPTTEGDSNDESGDPASDPTTEEDGDDRSSEPDTDSTDDEATEGNTGDSGTDNGDTSAAGLKTSGFSDAEKDQAKQVLSDVMGRMADGDYKGACTLIISPSMGLSEPMSDPTMLEGCAEGMKGTATTEDTDSLKAAKEMFKPENIEVSDDGSFSVLGQPVLGFKAVKYEEDGKMYLNVSQ